jgi:hypothetical protein
LALIHAFEPQFPAYNAFILHPFIYIATGIYGDRVMGELLEFDTKTKQIRACTDTSKAVHWLVKKRHKIDVYTYQSTGYYETKAGLFCFEPLKNKDLDYQSVETLHETSVPFAEDDIEAIINKDNTQKRLNLLRKLTIKK